MSQQLTPAQAKEFSRLFNNEMERITMSWDNQLKEWHKYAIKALSFANCKIIQLPQQNFRDLIKTESTGLNMNVVAHLCNNLEERSAHEMGCSVEQWGDILYLNYLVSERWQELADPTRKKLLKQFQIINNTPRIQIVGQA